MPKVEFNKPDKPVRKTYKKKCEKCGREINSIQFYNTNSALSGDGKLSICKSCVKSMIDYKNMESIYQILKQMDIPFYYSYWQTAKEKNIDDPWSIYIRLANSKINEFKNAHWENSQFEPNDPDLNDEESNKRINTKVAEFQITDEIIDKWGFGYSHEEYYGFEKKWNKLINNYGEKTSLHTEGLVTYIRFRVKEEMATAKGELKEAKEWGSLADRAADAAKINVRQLSKSDLSGGIDLVPQIFEAVESKIGVIPILPKLKEQPYDDADMIIWCVLNYGRRLEGKPRIEYKDVWNFYDKMLDEHFKQQGYTKDMAQKEKEKRNNQFRDLGKVYKEPIYEESDSQ